MSTWQDPPIEQFVSADVAPWHGVCVWQNWTLVKGGLVSGAYDGTAMSVPVEGDAFGEVLGDVFALGEGVPPPVLGDPPPRVAAKMPPPTPIKRIRTMAAIAGTSQGGRSVG